MQTENETWTATGLDANMPTHRMLLTLVGYIFAPRADRAAHNESGVQRPKISWLRALANVGLHLCVGLLVGHLASNIAALRSPHLYAAGFASAYLMATVIMFRARIVIWMIRLYQARAPEEIRAKCVMTPRCSDYMASAIEKHGLFAGVSKGVERLRRCGPPARTDYP